MKFMLLYLNDEQLLAKVPAAEIDCLVATHRKLAAELAADGRWVDGNRLQPTAASARLVLAGRRPPGDRRPVRRDEGGRGGL